MESVLTLALVLGAAVEDETCSLTFSMRASVNIQPRRSLDLEMSMVCRTAVAAAPDIPLTQIRVQFRSASKRKVFSGLPFRGDISRDLGARVLAPVEVWLEKFVTENYTL